MLKLGSVLVLAATFVPAAQAAIDCTSTLPASVGAVRPTVLAPLASELAPISSQLGAPRGVLSNGFDETQSVDQVLYRLRVESCHKAASLPAPGAAKPNDPAGYKPKTEFDNTPYRFNMTQNGKRMTADDFDAWLKANGYSVGRRVDTSAPAAAPAAAPAESATKSN